MVVGYVQARNLMKQLDWKLVVVMVGDAIEQLILYHPKQPNRYTVRRDSGKKLLKECRVCGKDKFGDNIYCYDHDGSNESLI